MCFEMVGLAVLKLAAIAPAVRDCEANRSSIDLLVGSAIAWKTSLLKFIMKSFGYKYKCSYLTTQIFFTFFVGLEAFICLASCVRCRGHYMLRLKLLKCFYYAVPLQIKSVRSGLTPMQCFGRWRGRTTPALVFYIL
jgi:hypothetical protein